MIEIDDVTKHYRIYHRKADWLKERVLRRPLHTRKTALDRVSFDVAGGEVVGVIGRNGAGKSTLLKMVMGVTLPDHGQVRVTGRVTGLLELGTGFNNDLTGRENIAFNAALLGMSPEEIEAKREEIIRFTELGTAIDDPLRTYSSGMRVRLGFAIAIHAEPSCFVVDEALSVGDIAFQQKCMRRIREFRANGGAILFVSHDTNAIKVLCDRAVVLEEGAVAASGDPDYAVNRYNRIIARMADGETDRAAPEVARAPRQATGMEAAEPTGAAASYGTGELEITAVDLAGRDSEGHIISAGEHATLTVHVRAREAVREATLGFLIRDRFGQDVYGVNTHNLNEAISLDAGERGVYRFDMPMNVGAGKYSITVAVHRDEHHLDHCYHWCDNAAAFEVAGFKGHRFQGLCRLEPSFSAEVPETADA
jgi:lipopolysaccharide transport system ATP-binding protein